MVEQENNTQRINSSWPEHFNQLIKNTIYAAFILGGSYYYAESNAGTNPDNAELIVTVVITGFVIGGIFALLAAWHALIAIVWPILVIFGIAGVTAVKSVDETGGVRAILHRIWYGKQGPPI